MRLDRQSSESSLGGGGGGVGVITSESNQQQHPLHINSNNNSISQTGHHQQQQHQQHLLNSEDNQQELHKTNHHAVEDGTSSGYNTANTSNPLSSDNITRNPFDFHSHSSQNEHYLFNNRDASISKAQQLQGRTNEEGNDPETITSAAQSSYQSPSAPPDSLLHAATHHTGAYNYAAAAAAEQMRGANELLNRYCLEQTIRHLHEFQDARNLTVNNTTCSVTTGLTNEHNS